MGYGDKFLDSSVRVKVLFAETLGEMTKYFSSVFLHLDVHPVNSRATVLEDRLERHEELPPPHSCLLSAREHHHAHEKSAHTNDDVGFVFLRNLPDIFARGIDEVVDETGQQVRF